MSEGKALTASQDGSRKELNAFLLQRSPPRGHPSVLLTPYQRMDVTIDPPQLEPSCF